MTKCLRSSKMRVRSHLRQISVAHKGNAANHLDTSPLVDGTQSSPLMEQ